MESVMKSIDERAQHKREYDNIMNERQMQSKEEKVDSSKALDASLVVKECSRTKSDKHDTSNRFGNDTHAEDVDIKPVNDKEPMAEVIPMVAAIGSRQVKIQSHMLILDRQKSFRHSDTERLSRSDEVLYLKNFKKDVLFKLSRPRNNKSSGDNQDYYTGQDYSMGHGLAHDMTQGSAPVEDDSLVKEVVPVKAKKVSKRHQKPKTTDNQDSSKPWTTAKDVALCKAWCDVS
nr:hypothetical protein [Tanacetum cinerariifolium]